MHADERWMRRALREAVRATGHAAPNPPVGCVIVRDGALIARGHTQPPPGLHAEAVALRNAGAAARGATMYVTLEPCNHHGRTPPCAAAIVAAGIRRVVVAVRDPHGAAAGGVETLLAAGIEVETGLCAPSASRVMQPFLHWAATRRPYVVLKSAMTLDGKIASNIGASRWITGPIARAYVHRLRARLGAVMVGIGTALADDPMLDIRRVHSAKPAGPPPLRIVADSRLRLPLDARLVRTAREAPLLVACRDDADPAKVAALRAAGADVAAIPSEGRGVDIAILMEELGARGVSGILLEGGGELAFSALDAGAVDEVITFVAPKILGGREAPTPVEGAGYATPAGALAVAGLTARRCGPDVLLSGRPAAVPTDKD